MEIENEKEITNSPIGAQKVNFQPFLDIMTDRPTDQPSDGQTNQPTVRWTDQPTNRQMDRPGKTKREQ